MRALEGQLVLSAINLFVTETARHRPTLSSVVGLSGDPLGRTNSTLLCQKYVYSGPVSGDDCALALLVELRVTSFPR